MERNKKTFNLHLIKRKLMNINTLGLVLSLISSQVIAKNDINSKSLLLTSGSDSLTSIFNQSGLFNNNELTRNQQPLDQISPKTENKPKAWYEKFSLGGYVQVRYNRLFETNPKLVCEQCDRSIGDNNGFFIRRNRLRVAGQIHPQVYMYIQYDFASTVSATAQHYGQVRDAYFDVGLDKNNEFRFRIGQSKVPYGFINMQSSQNRLNLDRDDGMNSGLANERDLGVFFYWAPKKKRELLDRVVKEG